MLGFKFEDERQIPVMLFYIKTCLKFTVKGTSDPDAAEKLCNIYQMGGFYKQTKYSF